MGHLVLLGVCLMISITAATKNATRPIFDPALGIFLSTLEEYESQPNEVVFLLDESGSIGSERYGLVKLFTKLTVRRLLVSAQHSRVAIISFSDYTREKANYIWNSQGNNMCTLIKVINDLDYVGQGTRTSLAMEVASEIFVQARPDSNKIIVLLTDGMSNAGYSPVEAAKRLKQNEVIIFAVGVADVNVQEVEDVATSKNHIYILSNFSYIENVNNYLKESISDVSWDLVKDTSLCNNFCINRTDCCDSQASCNCGTQSGSYQCACNAGYHGTGHRNNCFMCARGTYKPKVGNGACEPCPQHSTTSREGSTSLTDCSCEIGYQNHGDYCKAVECAKLKAPPGGILIPADCSNLFGSECTLRCKEGYCPHSCNSDLNSPLPQYRLSLQSRHCLETGNWSGEDFHCEEMRCPVLDHPLYGKHNCSGSGFVFGTACSFACDNGYELSGSNFRECLVNGTWTGSEAKCTEVYCDPLKGNLNLLVKPTHCTRKKMKFNSVCQYYCARGYNLTSQFGVNDGINKCLANKTWSGVKYDIFCRDISPPSIRCPKSITTATDPSKATAMVKWKEPNAVDNVFVSSIEIKEPSFVQKPHAFPIKTTKVVYEAFDSSGLSDTCSFTVTVIDKEAPQVLFCPKDIEVYHEKKTPIPITWQEPKFTDNSGKWNSSVSNRKSGDHFSWGPPSRISYNVTDPSGNMAFCNFTIKVRQYPCPELKVPENGIITCDNWQDGHLCSVFCKDNYEFALSQKVPNIFRCGQKGIGRKKQMQWIPFKLEKSVVFKFPIPDCSRIQKRSALNSSVQMNFTVDTCNEATLNKMRKKFIENLKLEDKKYKGMICPESKGCRPENVNITCVSPPLKVKRSIQSAHEKKAILMISFNVEMYPSTNESLDESFTNDTSMAQSNPLIQDIEAQVSKDVREVYNMPTLPTPQVKYDVVLICSIGQIKINDSCVNCPTGTYKDDFSDTCIDCPSATYQDKESSLSCLPCPKDYTTFNTRSKSKDDCKAPCQPGTYSKTTFEPCDICPFNMYQEYSYGKECLKCPNGLKTWRVGSNSSSDCSAPCNPGSYSDTGLEPCTLCEYGFYQNIFQEKSCEPCPGNTSTDIKGAKDSTQCKEINLCKDIHPCSNVSTCIPIRNTYKCVCPYGLFGEHCEMYVDQCEPDTCSNNGTCVSSYGINKCICPEGFSGNSCESNIDDCKQGYCQNNGKCIDLINDFLCECQSGFTGPKCEININDCALNPCLNGGICFDKIQGYKCCCPTGYAGKNCDVKVDLCSKILCLNDGVCESNKTLTTCMCKTGFSGEFCEIDIDDCTNYDCLNNGTCLDGIDKAVCDCPLMFTGSHCEQETSPEYFLSFKDPITSNYVLLENTKLLYAITISFFMRSNYQNSDSYPTPVSYSYYDQERKLLVSNALTLFDINRIVLYLHGEMLHTGFVANSDSNWHHYAVTWERNEGQWTLFVDGEAVSSGIHVGVKRYFYPGTFVLGQEQDSLGGTFSTSEAFVGDITEFNAWDYAMSEEEIKSISSHCGVVGNIVPWVKAINHISGTVTISKDVDICKAIGSCFSNNCHCLYSSRQTDDLCKHSVQNCNPNPCSNAQQCAVKDTKFFCNCSTGYDGKFCELDKNECLLNNGNCTHLCINTVGSYECKCPEGMILSDDGFTCKDTSYCELGGQVHLDGESWMLDCQTCLCKQGTIDCHNEECKAIECRPEENLILFPGNCCPKCVLYSFCFMSPTRTLTTFDYSLIKFSTECAHTMVEDCVNGLYSVRYESSKINTSESNLLIYDNCMKIQVSRTGSLLLDDNSVPASFKSKIFSIESNNETIDIYSKSGLFVQWHTNGETLIAVPAETAQHTCGLCGNYQVYNATANGGLGYTDGSLVRAAFEMMSFSSLI